jgi:glycosyltransferase involved in cell wall biosynthesis
MTNDCSSEAPRNPQSLPRVAVVHPGLGFGGSEAPVLWTLEALKKDYNVSLITTGKIDLARLNTYYGTNLAPEDFSVQYAPLPMGLRSTAKFVGLKGSFYQRYVRRVAANFDVMISCYGPMDFGRRGIQMIADFAFVEEWRFSLHPGVRSWKQWWYGRSPLRRIYMTTCWKVCGASPGGWKRNLNLANSDWSANLLRERFGVESKTLYPPVEGGFPDVPFGQRENGFVCIGSVLPEKRMDRAIEVLRQVRAKGHDIHIHILGSLMDSPFGKKIQALADQHGEWVFLEGRVGGLEKKKLIAQHRYGIHARQNEPFGIAVAELVQAGCITFVPNGGGQMEIVNHPELIYGNDDDAVQKIVAVLENPALQEALRSHLAQGAARFSVREFEARIRVIVREFLERRLSL